MKVILLILGLYAILTTLLPFIKSDKWWIRVYDYPRVQIMGLALISLFGIVFYSGLDHILDYAIVVFLAACAVYQGITIVPYTPLFKKQVKKSSSKRSESVSLLVANVLMKNKQVEKLLDIIKDCDPDLILAVETDQWWYQQLSVLEEDYPYSVVYPLENTYGMVLFSKLELKESEVKFLVDSEIPSIYTKIKLRNNKEIQLYGLHPTPPVPGENDSSTERDAELLMVGKSVRNSKIPVIVAGDLNDVAWSYTTKLFQKISGLLDPRIGRGVFNTYNAKNPLMRWPLDHVFHSSHFNLIQLARLPYFGSDHFPIFINLSFDPQDTSPKEEPSPDKQEVKEANEKIEKV